MSKQVRSYNKHGASNVEERTHPGNDRNSTMKRSLDHKVSKNVDHDDPPTDDPPTDDLPDDYSIGERIAAYRRDLKMTQKELADNLGVTVTTIANWENGRRNLNWLVDAQNICTALQCELIDLVGKTESEPTYDELLQLFKAGQLKRSNSDDKNES